MVLYEINLILEFIKLNNDQTFLFNHYKYFNFFLNKRYKDSELLVMPHKRYQVTQEKLSGRCNLRINKNKNEDEGVYRCCINDIHDKVDENKTSCRVYVLEPAFRFSKRLPTQMEAQEDTNLELDCEIEDEDAECEWYFNDEKINPEDHPDKYEIVVSGLKRKLIIKKCDPKKDRGHYMCKCGVSTTSTAIGVKPALKFVRALEPTTEVIEETDVELIVEVTKPNQRCKWLKNGRIINPNEEKYAGRLNIVSEGCIHRLSIKNVALKDACEIEVHVDELNSKTNFVVKECEKIPRVDLSQVPKVIKVKAGKDIDLEVPYESFPIPHARWLRNGEVVDMQKGLRHFEKNDNKKANLKINKAERGDSGKYQLVLSNSKGEFKVPIEIEVIDKPGAPEGPLKVTDVFQDNATLSWKKPLDDGGVPITGYVIEKMDVAKGGWMPVETVSGKTTSAKVNKLTPMKEYKFRVRAVNSEGESPNLETEHKVLAKNPFDEPKAPGKPEITDWDTVS